ncbi:hypothetical protein WJX82_006136 [Trebouxia sp. C0006]
MSSRSAQPSLFEPDTLMQAAELQVLKDEYRRALQEPPWDGYCGLVKVSEDDSVLQPSSSPLEVQKDGRRSPGASEAASQQDAVSEPVGSPLGPAPPGLQFAEQTFNQPAAVTAGYSEKRDAAEQLLLKLESLQTAEGLSAGGTQGQKARIAEEAFAEALQCLEQGNVAAAVNLLKVAQAACPTNKPHAQARIILLLGRCQQMTGPAKPETAPQATASTKAGPVTQSVPSSIHMEHAQTEGHAKKPSSEDLVGTDEDNKQKADKLFQAGLEALNRGGLGAAMQHLQDARTSCPRSKPGALVKIQRFINLIEAQEKRTLAS